MPTYMQVSDENNVFYFFLINPQIYLLLLINDFLYRKMDSKFQVLKT